MTVWSKLMTTMPASQARLIVGFSAESEAASTRIASGFCADDVVERVDLRLDRALGDLDVQVDLALERALVDRDLGDALHLLAPVVADEVVGEIDDVGRLGLGRRGRGVAEGAERGERGEADAEGLQHGFVSFPLVSGGARGLSRSGCARP